MVKAEGTSARASGSRRVYRESQADATLSVASVKQIATNVAPFGVFLALTIGTHYSIHCVVFRVLLCSFRDSLRMKIELRRTNTDTALTPTC